MMVMIITFCFQASLIGHMDNLGLLKSNTVFMEFGAGRGRVAVIENSCSHLVLSINCKRSLSKHTGRENIRNKSRALVATFSFYKTSLSQSRILDFGNLKETTEFIILSIRTSHNSENFFSSSFICYLANIMFFLCYYLKWVIFTIVCKGFFFSFHTGRLGMCNKRTETGKCL